MTSGMMEWWNNGRLKNWLYPIIPLFHYSNIPIFHSEGIYHCGITIINK
jgi:hypothetical protein